MYIYFKKLKLMNLKYNFIIEKKNIYIFMI